MQEPVHGCAGKQRVAEERVPLLDGAVGGDDHGAALVAPPDDLVEVEGLVAGERPQAEVVEDEEVGAREAPDLLLVALIGPRCAQLHEQVVERHVEGRVAGTAGALVRVTVGTPPTWSWDFYRAKLADELATKFGLTPPDILWMSADPFNGTAVSQTSGDFACCAKWGARFLPMKKLDYDKLKNTL